MKFDPYSVPRNSEGTPSKAPKVSKVGIVCSPAATQNHGVTPSNPSKASKVDASVAVVQEHRAAATKPTKPGRLSEAELDRVVETIRSAPERVFQHVGDAPIEMPACPSCGSRRLWLGLHGKIVCSKCSEVAYAITAMEYVRLQ